MGELLPWMWYSKDYGRENYRVAVLFNYRVAVLFNLGVNV